MTSDYKKIYISEIYTKNPSRIHSRQSQKRTFLFFAQPYCAPQDGKRVATWQPSCQKDFEESGSDRKLGKGSKIKLIIFAELSMNGGGGVAPIHKWKKNFLSGDF